MTDEGIADPLRPNNESTTDATSTSALNWHKWRSVLCAVAAHSCIGGIYTFSLFVEPLARNHGVVGVSALDWNVSAIIPVFSLTVTIAGLTAAFTGTWAERVGPSKAISYAGFFWGGGLILCALGLRMHALWIVYGGYGLLGGFGVGLAYAPPVAGLIRWFPDRKGFASGLAIMGFGGGTLLASPIIRSLMDAFVVVPTSAACGIEGSVRPSAKDLAGLGYSSKLPLPSGCFEGGTGSTGAGETLLVLGICYLVVLGLAGYFFVQAPSLGSAASKSTISTAVYLPSSLAYVPAQRAMLTPQFARVWIALFTNATAGIALLGVAKTIISDVYAGALGLDSSVGPMFVAILSFSNALGRIAFARLSDTVGRKNTFTMFFACGLAIYALLPVLFGANHSPAAYNTFVALTAFAVAIYGGGFAIAPAYLADLFGTREVGAVYARLLTAWAAAGLIGPTLLAWLRRTGELEAMKTLVELLMGQSKTQALSDAFGGGPFTSAEELLSRPGVSLDALIELSGVDPRNRLYNCVGRPGVCKSK